MMSELTSKGFELDTDTSESESCTLISQSENGDRSLYMGPACIQDSQGTKVIAGVFLDAECSQLDPNAKVSDLFVNDDGMISLFGLMDLLMASTTSVTAHKPLSCSLSAPLSSRNAGENFEINELCSSLLDKSCRCSDENDDIALSPKEAYCKSLCLKTEEEEEGTRTGTLVDASEDLMVDEDAVESSTVSLRFVPTAVFFGLFLSWLAMAQR